MSQDNPYESPRVIEAQGEFQDKPGLTNEAVARATVIVKESKSVIWVVLLSFVFCPLSTFIILPWFYYRYRCWCALHEEYQELRHPNFGSPNHQLVAGFLAARGKLLAGMVVGAAVWVLGPPLVWLASAPGFVR